MVSNAPRMVYIRTCLVLFHFVCCFYAAGGADVATVVCKSIEIQNLAQLKQLSKCDVVVGHVSILNIEINEQNIQKMATIQEITDYLFVYRVRGIRSLERLFPKLLIIRGMKLLFNKYSLVIYENVQLNNLGLSALLRIQRGSIRIEANPNLCFVNTVNWNYIIEKRISQEFSSKGNKPPGHCPLCPQLNSNNDSFIEYCWNYNSSQNLISETLARNCPSRCKNNGCDSKGICCELSCITSCSSEDCLTCKNFIKNGICVETCNLPYFQMNKRECITAQECQMYNRIPHAGACIEECPENYEKVFERGRFACKILCNGTTFVIHSKADLMQLSDCSKIKGSLVIELKDAKANIIKDMENALRNVKEISGYLKITRSPQLVSLSFLRKLDTIKGDELIDGKYALYVVDNYHLEHIWSTNQKVALLKGQIYFHLNPKLCYDKIMELESSIKAASQITVMDVSPNSNGERVICGDAIKELNVTVQDCNATAVLLKMQPLTFVNIDTHIGYSFHYKVAPYKNITRYDGRHGCGVDEWQLDISRSSINHHIISNLQSFTQYAFFVKTLALVDYHSPLDAYSPIQYFKTLPDKPGPVSKLDYQPISSTEAIIYWWPPQNSNGIISKYYLLTEEVDDESSALNDKSENLDCVCPAVIRPEESGFLPDNEVLYDKARISYTENLPNLVYVKRVSARSAKTIENETSKLSLSSIELMEEEDLVITAEDQKNAQQHLLVSSDANILNITTDGAPAIGRRPRSIRRREECSDFILVKPLPICTDEVHDNDKCEKRESLQGIEIPGHTHMHHLDKLKPKQFYKVTIQACVSGLENGCGRKKAVVIQTTSKKVEKFLNLITSKKN